MKNSYRKIAHFVVECSSPLSVSSGAEGFMVDKVVLKDANNLPFISGTSIAGILRHYIEDASKNEKCTAFGTDSGSRVIVSSAHLLRSNSEVVEKLMDCSNSFLSKYTHQLPERDHVAISSKGTAVKSSKFDEQLVFKGSRFAFRIEFETDNSDADNTIWNQLLNAVHSPLFRIGGGTRKGFGAINVVSCKTITYNLNTSSELITYLNYKPSLNSTTDSWTEFEAKLSNEGLDTYSIELTPESFYMFGAGYGDIEVDSTYKTEICINGWEDTPKLSDALLLIPATSVKGALAHRTAFYFNKLTNHTVDKSVDDTSQCLLDDNLVKDQSEFSNILLEINNLAKIQDNESLSDTIEQLKNQKSKIEQHITVLHNLDVEAKGVEWDDFNTKMDQLKNSEFSFKGTLDDNEAVLSLFGCKSDSRNVNTGQRGKVLLSDLFITDSNKNKIFNHVSIDRFTGGGRAGALFSEKVIDSNTTLNMKIFVEKDSERSALVTEAFESAIHDLVSGRLALGGMTTKGNGVFIGEFKKD